LPPKIIEAEGGIPTPAGSIGLLFPVHVADGHIEVGMFVEKV
jgi:hypothetical protein